MRENQLIARQKRRFKRTTDSEHALPIAPNLVAQDFTADGPGRKWGADISYVWTAEGWLYLAVVLDLFSRRVVGWATSDRLTPCAVLWWLATLRRGWSTFPTVDRNTALSTIRRCSADVAS